MKHQIGLEWSGTKLESLTMMTCLKGENQVVQECNECLIKTICIDPCEKFEFPDPEDIFEYISSQTLFDRLRNKHVKEKVEGIYKLSETETLKIRENGSGCWSDTKQFYILYHKYFKMRNHS